MNATGKLALFYASKGIDVFPLQANNKIPFKDFAWNERASRDKSVITNWFDGPYERANLGIACGARSGIVVLDVDKDHGGYESLAALEDTNGKLPNTPRSHTGSGGMHVIFKHPGVEVRNSAGKLGAGLDVRGDGGYIVAPPSVHPNGTRYEWDTDYKPSETPLADVPPWLLGLMTAKQEPAAQPKEDVNQGDEQTDKIPQGKRNQVLTSLAGTMRKRGMSVEAICTALLIENNSRCVPPLPDSEVQKIAESVNRYDHEEQPGNNTYCDVEWTFAAAAYANPEFAISECGWLQPFYFTDKKLKVFWKAVLAGGDKVQAANEAGILSDLLSWQFRTNPNEAAQYAGQIARLAYLTKINERLAEVSRGIVAGEVTKVQTILGELAGVIPYTGRDPLTAGEAVERFTALLKRLSGRSLKTSIPDLDKKTGGLERQTLSILAARPSMGKSTLAWQISRNIAAGGKKVLFFSLEMSAISLIAKAVCGICGVSWVDVRDERATPAQMNAIERAANDFATTYGDRLLIDDKPNTTDSIWQLAAKHNPDLIVIDHLRLVGDANENEVIRLGQVSQRMKDLAKGLNCHVMILAQLNREVAHRGADKRPQMTDLRDSGQVEENADLLMMLHRDDYWEKPDGDTDSITEVILRKFRDGDMNTAARLKFDKGAQWFNDL